MFHAHLFFNGLIIFPSRRHQCATGAPLVYNYCGRWFDLAVFR